MNDIRHRGRYNQPEKLKKKTSGIIGKAILVNIYILAVIVLAKSSPVYAYVGGLALIAYFMVVGFMQPKQALFLFFGVKLSFDAFWFIEAPEIMNFRLTELFLLPVLLVIFLGFSRLRTGSRHLLLLPLGFVAWVSIAMTLNNQNFDVPLIIRLSGSLIGLFIGLTFIHDRENLHQLLLLVFVSTVMPVMAAFFQIIGSYLGVSFLFYSTEATRELRLSGLYFDAATTGMVNIISLITAGYLLLSGTMQKSTSYFMLAFMALTFFSSVAGGTRSILITSSALIAVMTYLRASKMLKFIPLLGLLLFVSKPYLDGIMLKSTQELKHDIDVSQILTNAEYGQLFTGRVNLWQDVWRQFNDGSVFQMLFGSGINTDAHSTYFFLLLFVGWLGLFYYMFYNLVLLRKILGYKGDRMLKYASLFCLLSIFLVGFAASTVVYTSFQWIAYLIVGSVISISTADKKLNMQQAGQRQQRPLRR